MDDWTVTDELLTPQAPLSLDSSPGLCGLNHSVETGSQKSPVDAAVFDNTAQSMAKATRSQDTCVHSLVCLQKQWSYIIRFTPLTQAHDSGKLQNECKQ